MWRRIRTIFVGVLGFAITLLWVATAVLWARSYWRGDGVIIRRVAKSDALSAARTFLILSGKGGVLLAMRDLRQQRVIFEVDATQWTVYDNPAYPQPTRTVFAGVLRITGNVVWTPVGRPMATATDVIVATPPSASFVISRSPGSAPTISVAAAPPTTVPAGAIVATDPGQGTFTVTVPGPSPTFPPGMTRVGTGTLTMSPPAPTTMGSAFDKSAIATPPTPMTGSRQFIAYEAGTPFSATDGLGDISRVLVFPYWAMMLVLTLAMYLPIRPIVRAMQCRRRAAMGCCVHCGYDLRATPGRCPECGTQTVTNHSESTKMG